MIKKVFLVSNMKFNEALITNNQVTLFAVLAGVVFSLIALTCTQGIRLISKLALLFLLHENDFEF